ncbi:MAG: NAD(P)H-binding protein [Sandaracinus sp.]
MTQTVAILGASGKLGREVVAEALARGHRVRALVRHAAARPVAHETLVIGDARDEHALRELVRGADAVVSLIGPVADSGLDLSTRFTDALLAAMQAEGVARLVYVTGAMVGHPRAQRGLVYRLIPRLMGATARAQLEDRRRAEASVLASPLRWTVVRPPRLAEGPPRGGTRWGEDLRVGSLASIRRSDLARLLLDAVSDPRTERRAFVAMR